MDVPSGGQTRCIHRSLPCITVNASTPRDERSRLKRRTMISSIGPDFDVRSGNFHFARRSGNFPAFVLENYFVSLESKRPQYSPPERVPSLNSNRREHAGGTAAGENKVIRYVNVSFTQDRRKLFRTFD